MSKEPVIIRHEGSFITSTLKYRDITQTVKAKGLKMNL